MCKNDDLGFQKDDVEEKKSSPPLLVLDVVDVSILGVDCRGEGKDVGVGGCEVVEYGVLYTL